MVVPWWIVFFFAWCTASSRQLAGATVCKVIAVGKCINCSLPKPSLSMSTSL